MKIVILAMPNEPPIRPWTECLTFPNSKLVIQKPEREISSLLLSRPGGKQSFMTWNNVPFFPTNIRHKKNIYIYNGLLPPKTFSLLPKSEKFYVLGPKLLALKVVPCFSFKHVLQRQWVTWSMGQGHSSKIFSLTENHEDQCVAEEESKLCDN